MHKNTLFSLWAYSLACLAFGSWLHPSAQGVEVDAEMEKRLIPFRKSTLADEDRPRLRNELSAAVPDWEDRLAMNLAKLAIDARYDGRQLRLGIELARLDEKRQRRELTEEENKHYWEVGMQFRAEGAKVALASQARSDMVPILEALARMRDNRVVRLIGPLLADQSEEIDIGDAFIQSVQRKAAGALFLSRSILPNAPYDSEPENWRRWWKENRHRYEPIPAPLAAFEASEGGAREPLGRR